jgi:Tfp pilus assembly protein PilF
MCDDALSSCRKSLELDRNVSETWHCEASILLNLGRSEEALYSCEAALKLNEKDAFAWTTLGSALADMDLFDESFRAFSRELVEPQSPSHAPVLSIKPLGGSVGQAAVEVVGRIGTWVL